MTSDANPDPSEERVTELFATALEKRTSEERKSYLAQACGEDQELCRMVESLLEAHAEAGEFLNRSVMGDDTEPLSEGPGTVIKHYRLVEKLGEGGFGVVYLAQQEQPVRRQVALKIIKLGMDTRRVIARFEAERQALALMDHPNIAHVYEAGATETGRPYFVMELAQGTPITEYCDEQRLHPDQRLDLFLQVCRAVQHAHQKGIIHRDLKPSNIVVTLKVGQATPKVIDFGIAKSTQIRLTDNTQLTQRDLMVGTPAYMSPEQVGLGATDVDTRSDIYSLGVLLYELLTGTLPFPAEELRHAAIEEARQIIREQEPRKPSTRLAALGPETAQVARLRGMEPRALQRFLHGDLDWIVMKALDKEPGRRYATINALIEDLRRHREHEPVTAGPPGAAYRVRKFVRRHRQIVLAGGAVLVALFVGLVASTVQWYHARAAQQRAERERENALALVDLLRQMLGADYAQPAHGADRTVRDMTDAFANALGDRLQNPPDLFGEMHQILGRVYNGLDDFDSAYRHHRQAVKLFRQAYGPRDLKVADSLAEFSWFVAGIEGCAPAVEMATEAMEIYLAHGIQDVRLSHTLTARANFRQGLGQMAEAEADARQALQVARRVGDLETVNGAAYWLGAILVNRGKVLEGERLFRQVVEAGRRSTNPASKQSGSNLRFALRRVGVILVNRRQYAEAELYFREALPMFLSAAGAASQHTFDTLTLLRGTLHAQGRVDPEVDRIAREAAIQQVGDKDRASVSYRLRISTPGEYRLYLRWDGANIRSDSVWAHVVELNDGVGGSVPDVYGFAVALRGSAADADFATEPVWQSEAYLEEIGGWHGDEYSEWKPEMGGWPGDGPAKWRIAFPGEYTLRFVMREPGAALDAFVFQLAGLPAPGEQGPQGSHRTPNGVFEESGGRIVIEAERFTKRLAGHHQRWQIVPLEGSGQAEFKNFRGQGYLQTVRVQPSATRP